MLSALALASLAQLPQLDELVRDADRIVVGTVAAVTEVSQSGHRVARTRWPKASVPIVELRVTRTLLGPAGLERTFVVGARVEAGKIGPRLSVGDDALLFLDHERIFPFASDETLAGLKAVTEGEPLFQLHRIDAPVFGDDHGLAAVARLAERVQLPAELERFSSSPRDSLLAWIDRRLDEVTPSFEARSVTTGPYPWSVRIEADGAWSVDAPQPIAPAPPPGKDDGPAEPRAGTLTDQELASLFEIVDPERFYALPSVVGRSPGPDSGWRIFELRTRHGTKRVHLYQGGAEDAPGRERLERIWRSLPDAGMPDHLR